MSPWVFETLQIYNNIRNSISSWVQPKIRIILILDFEILHVIVSCHLNARKHFKESYVGAESLIGFEGLQSIFNYCILRNIYLIMYFNYLACFISLEAKRSQSISNCVHLCDALPSTKSVPLLLHTVSSLLPGITHVSSSQKLSGTVLQAVFLRNLSCYFLSSFLCFFPPAILCEKAEHSLKWIKVKFSYQLEVISLTTLT